MNGIFRIFGTIFVTGLALSALVACGGGGGSGSGVTYDGVATQALINDANAEQLAIDAYNGGNLSDSLVAPLSFGADQAQALVPLATLLVNSLPPLDFAPTVHAQATSSEVLYGSCGGSATMTVSEGSTTASGSIVYSSYCDAGVTLSGSISFTASVNTQTGIVSMSMRFGELTTAEGTLYGNVSMRYNWTDPMAPLNMGMDIVITDAMEQTYWIKDHTHEITPGTGFYDSVEFSGTYYDFDLGYVAITTTSPLQVDSFTGVLEAGSLHFVGREGTYADLVANGGGTYTLTVSTGTIINGTF